MIAEKVRAAFQRTRVRDLYDLYRFAILYDLSELERQVIADVKSGWNDPLANQLRSEILRLVKDSLISL